MERAGESISSLSNRSYPQRRSLKGITPEDIFF